MAGTSSVDFILAGTGEPIHPSNSKMCSGHGSVRVDQNAPKVGMRPRVGILSSAPSRRAIASVHRGRTCRAFICRRVRSALAACVIVRSLQYHGLMVFKSTKSFHCLFLAFSIPHFVWACIRTRCSAPLIAKQRWWQPLSVESHFH